MKKKILLLFNPLPDPREKRVLQLGLLAISSLLDKEGYDIRLFHSFDNKNYMDFLKSRDSIICAGITAMTGHQILDGLKFAKLLRKYKPGVPIVWGGPHPSILADQTLENEYVDIVVRGQGERTFWELVHCLEEGRSFEKVTGISYKTKGQKIHNPDRSLEDINNFPPFPFHILGDNIEKYIMPGEFGKRTIRYSSSYGCPHRCGFCEVSRFTKRRWTALKSERVLKDIEFLVREYRIDSITFLDPNFFVNKDRVIEISNGLLSKGIKISWEKVNGRPEQLSKYDDETWRLLVKAGLRSLFIGAESGDQEVLDIICKDSKVGDTLLLAEKAKKFGVKLFYSFIITGIPYHDTEKTADFQYRQYESTIDFINTLLSRDSNARVRTFFYAPYPDTGLYPLALKNGFKEPATLPEWAEYNIETNNLPWLPDRLARIIPHAERYIDIFIISKKKLENKRKGFIKTLVFKTVFVLSYFRLKKRFFIFPIESVLFRMYERIKYSREKQI